MAFDASKMNQGGAASSGSMIGSALAGSQAWGIPDGFDTQGFLGAAKRNFVTLQDAWDRADIAMVCELARGKDLAALQLHPEEFNAVARGGGVLKDAVLGHGPVRELVQAQQLGGGRTRCQTRTDLAQQCLTHRRSQAPPQGGAVQQGGGLAAGL